MCRWTFVVALSLSVSVSAQTLPSTLKQTGAYASTVFGLTAGAGGIEFNSAGTKLYINDRNNNKVMVVDVVRNANNKIIGFKSPVLFVASNSTSPLDGGLSFDPIGTVFFNNYSTSTVDVEQYSPTTKAHTVTNLKTLGLAGSTGGAEYFARNASLLVGDYTNGGIFEFPLTRTTGLVYTIGKGTLWCSTPTGIDGFEFIPSGPFGNGRGLLLVNYDNSRIDLVSIDAQTGKPFLDAVSGKPFLIPVVTGLSEPMDVEFDPITGDLFLTDYSNSTSTVVQYSGVIGAGLDGAFDLYGPGCAKKGGGVPTVTKALNPVRVNVPVQFSLTNAPANQAALLIFGLGPTGNLGGITLPATSCKLFVNPMVMVPIPTNGSGVGSFTLTIPVTGVGISLYTQGWVLSSGANPLGFVLSDAAVSLIAK